MDVDLVLALSHEMLILACKLAAPALLSGLIIGLVVSIVQTATTIQDSTLTLVPKMLGTLVALYLTLPWMVGELVQFVHRVSGVIGAL